MPIDRDLLAARLLETFSAELEDQIMALNAHLLSLETAPDKSQDQRAVFRIVHTLKGAARAAGVSQVEATCDRLETLLSQVREGEVAFDASIVEQLFKGTDELAAASMALKEGSSSSRLTRPQEEHVQAADVSETPPESAREERADSETDSYDSLQNAPVAGDVRVNAEHLFDLLGASSQLYIAVGGLKAVEESIENVKVSLNSLIRTQGAGSSTDEYDQIALLARDVNRVSMDMSEAYRMLSLISSDIGTGVRSLRLRPFSDIETMFSRVVRDAAHQTGKRVELIVEGGDVRADRTVIDEMQEAIMHLVRNAVAHGIESPEDRRRAGKPETGTVRIISRTVVDHIIVTVSDDGAGIDINALKKALQARGDDVPHEDREVIQHLFNGGLSTQKTVDSIAGRGVGLDAVRAAMSRIRGSADVTWEPGRHTVFTLEAPVSLANIRAVLCKIGSQLIAIPDAYIDRLKKIRASEIRIVNGRTMISPEEESEAPIPLVSLAQVLGPPMVTRPLGEHVFAVLVEGADKVVALTVDELVGEEEIIVRPISNKGKRVIPHISGAAMLRDGRVALVANATSIVNRTADVDAFSSSWAQVESQEIRRQHILVVDDSITTRTLEQSVLESAGYDVSTAVDGAEAWQMLQDNGADLVVSDVEMPRMDGFALCRAIRSSTRFRELPVILVTALENEEDRERGIEAGADAYLTKSSFDQATLVETVSQLIA